MDEYPIPAAPQYDSRSGTVIVFLSLFFLILAFFIVLVTISTVEKVKSKAVMNSVTTAFTTNLPPRTDPTTDFTAKEGDVLAGQAFQEEITGIAPCRRTGRGVIPRDHAPKISLVYLNLIISDLIITGGYVGER